MKETFRVSNTLVKGKGYSYNLNNKYDAVHLANILNSYENQIQNTEDVEKHLIKIAMDISILKADIEELKEVIKC